MALITGQSGTDDVLGAELVVDMGTKVFGYDPPENPYTRVVTKRLKSKPAKATKVSWMEDDIVPYWDTAAETVNSGASDFDVTNDDIYQVGDLVKNVATGEIMRVLTVTTGNIAVDRGYAGSSAAAVTSGDYLLNLRIAQAEGANSPAARATVKVEKYNFTQIVKTPVHITETNRVVAHYHGSEEGYQLRKAGTEHARNWEEILMHGGRSNDTTTAAHPIRTAGGLDWHIQSNVLAAGGTLTETEFKLWLADCFRFKVNGGQGGTKLLFASRAMKLTIDSWGENKLVMNKTASATYGMDISTYQGSTGTVHVINHPLLEYGYAGTSYLVDPDGCMWRPLRSTQLHRNIQAPDEDGRKHEYRTEGTFQFALEKCFGKITGVTYA